MRDVVVQIVDVITAKAVLFDCWKGSIAVPSFMRLKEVIESEER